MPLFSRYRLNRSRKVSIVEAESDRDEAELVSESPDSRRRTEFSSHPLVIEYEHRPGRGEDAPPISILWSSSNGLVGVFDGLGGAGGETTTAFDGKERTGAWIASRLAALAVQKCAYLAQATEDPDKDRAKGRTDFASVVKQAIQTELNEFATQIAGEKTRLRSSLFKLLPTTMAVSWFDLTGGEFTAVWAGDSRVYLLRPDVGLQQITTDDLKTNADALENLTQDSPMSNFISANADFTLHQRGLHLRVNAILLAASDGCFAYVDTPVHFEYMLLSTMHDAADWDDWSDRLTTAIKNVTADDATLSAIAIGWPDFTSCRHDYAHRFEWCEERVHAYEAQLNKVEELQRGLTRAKNDLAVGRRQLWEEYRQSYEDPLHTPERHIPQEWVAEQSGNRSLGDEQSPKGKQP